MSDFYPPGFTDVESYRRHKAFTNGMLTGIVFTLVVFGLTLWLVS